jgi:hypothetical protein
VTLGVVRYEFRDEASGTEANWLTGGVKIELSATGAFRCSCPVLYMADELSFFRDDLGRILARQKGSAALETEEDRVSITIDLDKGTARIGGYVKVGGFAKLEFEDIPTDEASLRKSHGELVELVREFPVRASS